MSHPHSTPKVLLKLDFENAFNSVRRDAMLNEVSKQIPDLFPFLCQCYRSPSHLFFGSDIIPSATGIQQGDPLGPALFCLVVHPLASSLSAEFNAWYLDDGSLGGSTEEVLRDFKLIVRESSNLGLVLNLKKCELFTVCSTAEEEQDIRRAFQECAPEIIFPSDEDCVLLGAPLKGVAIAKALQSKISDLIRLTTRLPLLSAHYAFYILKNSLAIPRLSFLLRCTPTWQAIDSLQLFDTTLQTAVEKVTNVCFTEMAKEQMSLPVAEGGLGLRKVTSLALSAFLSSVTSVTPLVNVILPAQIAERPDTLMQEGIDLWVSNTGSQPPSQEHRMLQSAWDKATINKAKLDLQERATTLSDKARLLGVSSKTSGAFLNVVPSPPLGTFLEDGVFRIAIGLRLGLDVCQPHTCICGEAVDSSGLHGLNCRKSGGRLSRHYACNDVIRRALVTAGFPVSLEPSFLVADTNIRPDGVTLTPWEGGKSLTWDFTCVNSLAPSYVATSAGVRLSTASSAEDKKKTKYAALRNSFVFVPIVAECLGSFGEDGLTLLKSIGRKMASATGEKRTLEFLFQRLSVAIQRGNAAAVLGTFTHNVSAGSYF